MYVPLSMENESSYMMNQTSWDVPESPTVSTPYHTSPMKPKYSATGIDHSKVKTKMCRNYQLGLPCPFEDRCAFVHGPVVAISSQSAPPPPPPSYTESLQTWSSESFNDSPVSSPRMDCPPAYPQKFRHDPYNPQGIIFEN